MLVVNVIIYNFSAQIGLIGLVEEEWLATLATIDPEDVEYKDFVTEGRRLARFLKQKACNLSNIIFTLVFNQLNSCVLCSTLTGKLTIIVIKSS